MTGSGAGRGMGGYQNSTLDLPDYLVRQHSILGLYLSLFPHDEGKCCSVWGSPLLVCSASLGIFRINHCFGGHEVMATVH